MTKFTLTIEGETLEEITRLFARNTPGGEVEEKVQIELPLAKRGRPAKKADAQPAAETGPTPEAPEPSAPTASSQPQSSTPEPSDTASDAEPEQHPMLKEFTLQDVKDAGGRAIGRNPKNGAIIKDNLKRLFDSQTFGGVKPEDYARCVAMLEDV